MTSERGSQPSTFEVQNKRMQELLRFEAGVRRQKTELALSLWAVNESRNVLEYSQAIVLRLSRSGKAKVTAFSDLSTIDSNAPFVRWIEEHVTLAIKKHRVIDPENQEKLIELPLTNRMADAATNGSAHSLQKSLFLPFYDRGDVVFGGLLITRRQSWLEHERIVSVRVADAVSHGFHALIPQKKLRLWSTPKWLIMCLVTLLVLALFIPVPMTTLAPAEIIADEPTVVAAPLDGVVARIYKDANVVVNKGELLMEFDNTQLKAAFDIASRKELISEARLATAQQAAFNDVQVHRQLAIAAAEVELAKAEKNYAAQKLARAVVRAEQSGQLIYSNRQEWIGKPVKTGERVMEIADIQRVVLQIYLPVADAISLTDGADVKLFLDADPLNSLSGKLRHASFYADEQPGVGLVYRVIADLNDGEDDVPRIGLRGTAQIFGKKVFLGFFLFRKPLATIRQYLGI